MGSAATKPKFVLLEEFLFPDELSALLQYAISREAEFQVGTVVTAEDESTVMLDHRRSRLLYELGPFLELLTGRVRHFLDYVLRRLAHEPFPVLEVDAALSACNEGDFFGPHRDVDAAYATREISYVYYFHREPKAFTGGELRIYEEDSWNHDVIVPEQNAVVFFPAAAIHEVSVVHCPSRDFADSRFALNGWIHCARSA